MAIRTLQDETKLIIHPNFDKNTERSFMDTQ